MTARLVVMVSGNGTNLQAVLDACRSKVIDAKVVTVVSNRSDSYGLVRAANEGIKTVVCAAPAGEARETYDERLGRVVARANPDLVVLAGWMRLLSMTFLQRFPNRVVNIHPALPGEYPGTRAIERALADAKAGARDHTGVMVHLVPDEGVDDGPVIGTETVPILPDDTFESLAARVHAAEHLLLVSTLRTLTSRRPTPDPRSTAPHTAASQTTAPPTKEPADAPRP